MQEVAGHMQWAVDAPTVGSFPTVIAAAVTRFSSVWMFALSEWAFGHPTNCSSDVRPIVFDIEPILPVPANLQLPRLWKTLKLVVSDHGSSVCFFAAGAATKNQNLD